MRGYLEIAFNLFLPLLHLLIIQKYMTTFLGIGNRKCIGYAGWIAYYVFLVIMDMGVLLPSQILLAGNILLVFIISTITRRKSLKKRCVFALLTCTVWMLVEVIVLLALNATGADKTTVADAGGFISKILMLFLSVLISHYVKEKHLSDIPLRYFLVILLIPLSSIYLMHHVFLIAAAHKEHTMFSAITSLLLLLVNYIIFELYDWMSRDAGIREQNRLYEQQLELCSHQAEERENLYLKIGRMRHDMKNHLSGLLGMVQSGETKDAETYIQGMLDDGISDRTEEVSRSGNIVVDSLVNHKYALAQKNDIRFDANVFIPAALPYQNGHLAIILGNLLENALEACRKVPQEQRYISLEIFYVKEVLQLCIKNSCLPGHKKDSTGRYLTTKKDTVNHGIGLSSVEQAVACYHGEVDAKDSGNEFRVTVIMYGLIEEK